MTDRQFYLRATVAGTNTTAYRKAEDKLSEFRTQVLKQRSAASSASFSYAIDEWMRTSEIKASTRKTYLGYIASHIKLVRLSPADSGRSPPLCPVTCRPRHLSWISPPAGLLSHLLSTTIGRSGATGPQPARHFV